MIKNNNAMCENFLQERHMHPIFHWHVDQLIYQWHMRLTYEILTLYNVEKWYVYNNFITNPKWHVVTNYYYWIKKLISILNVNLNQ